MTPPGESPARPPYPSVRWVRGSVGATLLVDSRQQLLVWEPELPVPRYLFPTADVRVENLRSVDPPGTLSYHHPSGPVDAWYDIDLGDRIIRHGAWQRRGFPDHLGVTWDQGALVVWREEDQVVVEHPHDPFVHLDALPSSRPLTVHHRGHLLASTRNAIFVWETGLPTRYYVPRNEIDFTHLTPSSTRSTCSYKGFATHYWSDERGTDIAWSYPEPFFPYRNIAGHVAFLNELVDITIDAIPQAHEPVIEWKARSRLFSPRPREIRDSKEGTQK
jgi:uncharacterized protein (DUF427 family)